YHEGSFVVRYADHFVPIAPDTFGSILSNGLDQWLQEHAGDVEPSDVEELRSIITATEHLPGRSSRESELIAVRAREKEVVKRRLAALIDRSRSLSDFVSASVARINGRRGDPPS